MPTECKCKKQNKGESHLDGWFWCINCGGIFKPKEGKKGDIMKKTKSMIIFWSSLTTAAFLLLIMSNSFGIIPLLVAGAMLLRQDKPTPK